jgi:uncharacterized protein YjbI with pentapeptide repeats
MLQKVAKRIAIIAIAFLLATLAYWGAFPDNSPKWTGFGSYAIRKDKQAEKKLWDWLQLLLVPSLLAVGGWWLNKSQKESEQKIETDRQQQKALDEFYNCVTDLMLKGDLFDGPKNKESRKIARIRTLTVLGTLDAERKGQVIQFLYESGLINKSPIVVLNGADLRNAALEGARLVGIEIRGAHFNRASLRGANLRESDIRGSDFSDADLTFSEFSNANIRQAMFPNAKLYDAKGLDTVIMEGGEFDQAHLTKDKRIAPYLFRRGRTA